VLNCDSVRSDLSIDKQSSQTLLCTFFPFGCVFFTKNVKKINTILNAITYPQVVFKLTY
jgi:hypothetical protein